MIIETIIISTSPGVIGASLAWSAIGVGVTTVWALLKSQSRGDLVNRLSMLRSGTPPVGKVDLSEGPLLVFVREFESQLLRVRKKPAYFNLVDLCGATRTCEHEATSEWYLNRAPDMSAFAKLRELTKQSKDVLENALSFRHWNYHEKEQIEGMISNVSTRLQVYDVLLSADLTLDQQAEMLDQLSTKMEKDQKELAELSVGNQR